MDGTLPEEPGQPAFSPLDVEPTSENVRTSDAPVSSRLRSARCGSIASGTNPPDHISAQVANGDHESGNLPHVHRPEAGYSDVMNGNGSGPFIQAPSGPMMLYRQDDIDRQSSTDCQELEVLTLVPFRSYRSLLFKFRTLCVFEKPFGGLGTTYDVHLGLIVKRVANVFRYVLRLSR